ncbi:hypothetical protein [Streptomyces sp. NPDC048659]|uniref:hypothetical protein n=1 Tax=Streptomyces sp. NPDC048659 TaxID=3155489 RepID=UPI00343F1959
MDFSGYATDFVLAGSPVDLFRRLSSRLHSTWPAHLLNGMDHRSFDFASIAPDIRGDGSESDIATFARDAAMEDFWEEHGYSLDSSGEGPFAIFYKPFRAFSLRVDKGFQEAGEIDWGGSFVLIPEGFHLSLVTPDDPSSGSFSGWVRRQFVESLSET